MAIEILKFRDIAFKVINAPLSVDAVNSDYLFMVENNITGFFFNKGLHIYGFSIENRYDNVFYINEYLNNEYGSLFKDLFAFACDIFGNQFVFSNRGIEVFEIETSERNVIAKDFTGWLVEIEKEKDYYFGIDLIKEWEFLNSMLDYQNRLTPKIPIILNGNYDISNLFSMDFFKIISFNADIAKQIVNIPDGSHFELRIKKNDT